MGPPIDLTIRSNLLVLDAENQLLKTLRQKQSQPTTYIGLGKLIDTTVSCARYSKALTGDQTKGPLELLPRTS